MSTTSTPPSRSYVVTHVAVSLDGATTGFTPAIGRFYELAGTWREDVTLAGADTILAQEQALQEAPRPGPAEAGPLLAVVDGKGRVREWAWEAMREVGHWSGVLALYAAATPPRPGREFPELVVGAERVDLAGVLGALAREHGARVVRVDSGGALIGALLGAGLIDEVSLLVHPLIVGTQRNHVWHGNVGAPTDELVMLANESLEQGLVWLRYRVERAS